MVGVRVNDKARRVGHLQDPGSGPSLRNVWQLFRHPPKADPSLLHQSGESFLAT